jgi:hypothetical protein
MSAEEYVLLSNTLKQTADQACKSKETARAFLVQAGILTPEGQLSEVYR